MYGYRVGFGFGRPTKLSYCVRVNRRASAATDRLPACSHRGQLSRDVGLCPEFIFFAHGQPSPALRAAREYAHHADLPRGSRSTQVVVGTGHEVAHGGRSCPPTRRVCNQRVGGPLPLVRIRSRRRGGREVAPLLVDDVHPVDVGIGLGERRLENRHAFSGAAQCAPECRADGRALVWYVLLFDITSRPSGRFHYITQLK